MNKPFFSIFNFNIIPQKYTTYPAILVALFTLFNINNIAVANENSCLEAVNNYEKLYQIPTGLLKAVSKVESEYNPLALNDGSIVHNFKAKEEVADKINSLINLGKTNFDVGCIQINYFWHGKNFSSIEEMINIDSNVKYAANLLQDLYKTHKSWLKAVRYYHSNDPIFYKKYSRKIALAWLKE
jgi:hypothetical protein